MCLDLHGGGGGLGAGGGGGAAVGGVANVVDRQAVRLPLQHCAALPPHPHVHPAHGAHTRADVCVGSSRRPRPVADTRVQLEVRLQSERHVKMHGRVGFTGPSGHS